MKVKSNVRPYTSKGGRQLLKPSIQLVMTLDNEGFCLACGETQGGVGPDARRYQCTSCKESMVFGSEELAMRGLTWDAS